METRPRNLKELIQQNYVEVARLPKMNDAILDGDRVDFGKLDRLSGYTIPVIAHDYSAITPTMWNSLYRNKGINVANIMVVADPANADVITGAFRDDPKYLGGGFGVGWKEKMGFLDAVRPSDLKSVNIVVKDGGRLIGYNTDADGFVKSLEEKLTGLGRGINGGNFVVVGAGGVAKQVNSLLAEMGANYIAIINRTFSKAVDQAGDLNHQFNKNLAIGLPETMTRGALLNSEMSPTAIINLSDKGSDQYANATFFYKAPRENNLEEAGAYSHIARDTVRLSVQLDPDRVYSDITLPKEGRSLSLRIVKAELLRYFINDRKMTNGEAEMEVEKRILDGRPMVIYQAAPAYKLVQDANASIHGNRISEDEALSVFKSSVMKN